MKKRLLDILKAYCKTERMKTMKIQKVLATEILDSRGTPTVGATVILSDGSRRHGERALRRIDGQI